MCQYNISGRIESKNKSLDINESIVIIVQPFMYSVSYRRRVKGPRLSYFITSLINLGVNDFQANV